MTVATELGSLPVFAGIPTAELSALAAELTPVNAPQGEVLMRQGEKALSFFIISSGEVEIRHSDTDGHTLVAFLSEGLIGEIALLRNAPRTATVIATDNVSGYLGQEAAFGHLLQIPGIAPQLVRTARQRLAAFLTPVPFEAARRHRTDPAAGAAGGQPAGGARARDVLAARPCTAGSRRSGRPPRR